jgi:tRNA-2-methylthio-N6-dimethylallyladenosine synthase
MSSIFIKTYGCQMNDYDSSHIVSLLTTKAGNTQTDVDSQADILILNTCSVREKAQEKIFHQLGRWRKYKEKNPKIIIAVGGCVASQEGKSIVQRANYVDVIFGPQTLHRLPQLIEQARNQKGAVVDTSYPAIEKFDHLPQRKVSSFEAFVTIMEGCSQYCSFCIVPYTRGEEISRPVNDVMHEVEQLALQGVREITLLGQNVNAYIAPIPHSADNSVVCTDAPQADLAYLIHLVAKVAGIGRIRFTTSNPIAFTDSLVEAYKTVPQLVDHLHLPIQSGADRMLALMKRNHTVLEYKAIIRSLRKIRPNISIASDFIIGFPGESAEDFAQTMELVQEINYDGSFSFIYSKRPGTPAAYLPDDVSLETKKQRLHILQDRLTQQAMAVSREMLGGTYTILVSGYSKKSLTQLHGRTENNRIVNFESDDIALFGKFVKVKISDVLSNCLLGEFVELVN